MVSESRQSYLDLIAGLTRASREKANAKAQALLEQAGLSEAANDAGAKITKLAEEIAGANRANRELFESLITAEVQRAVGRFGMARQEEVDMLQAQLAEVETELELLRDQLAEAQQENPRTSGPAPAQPTPAAGPTAKRSAKRAADAKKTGGAKKTARRKKAAAKKAAADGAAASGQAA